MTTLYRVRKAGLFGNKAILQRLDEDNGTEWRDVRYSFSIGLFTVVRLRYWQAIEAKLSQQAESAATRKKQRDAKKRTDFASSKFTDTRMPEP